MSTFEILDNYSALRRELSLIFAAELKNSNLGPQQAVILMRLSTSDCSMSELSAQTQSDPAATTRTVASLEKASLVKRTADPLDARKSIVQLTGKGSAQAEIALRIRGKIGTMLNKTLDVNERKTLNKLLAKIVEGLREERRE